MKLVLEKLEVKSFVTSLEEKEKQKNKGGACTLFPYPPYSCPVTITCGCETEGCTFDCTEPLCP